MKNTNRILLSLALVFSAACSSSSNEGPSGPLPQSSPGDVGVEIALAPGNTVEYANLNLRVKFVKVTQDSRCPTNATILCVWAGSAQAQFTVTKLAGDGETTIALETGTNPRNAIVHGRSITLVRVDPPNLTTLPIPAASYRAVIRVDGLDK